MEELCHVDGLDLCPRCREGEERDTMTLQELSVEYRRQAGVLKERMTLLRQQQGESDSPQERLALAHRIHTLEEIWREARDLAVLTERYYERGYRRNGRYTL